MSSDICGILHFTMSLKTTQLASNRVRVPSPSRGVATHVVRYKQEHSVILHPDDFSELEALDALAAGASELEPLEITELSERLHAEEERPGSPPIHDRDLLTKLLLE